MKSPVQLLAILLISIFLFTGCIGGVPEDSTPGTQDPGEPKYGGTLTILYTRDFTNYGYPATMGGAAAFLTCISLDNLVKVDDQLNFLPTGLATGFEVDPDGKSMTFTLRKGVKFHDGTDFDAEAVKWNFEQLIEKGAAGTDQWTSIDVIDKYTVRVNITEYSNATLIRLASSQGFMISPTAVQKNSEDWAMTHPIGTGPFKLKNFTPDVEIVYERNDEYWGDKPYLDGITVKLFKSQDAAGLAMEAGGEGHVFRDPDVPQAQSLERAGFKNVRTLSTMIVLVPDSANPDSPLANKKVREALEHAIDREAIAAIGEGYWAAVDQVGVPENPMSYDPSLGREYNPELAKQLIEEAGYPDGFKLTINTRVGSWYEDALLAVVEYFKEVGVEAELDIQDDASFRQKRRDGWSGFYKLNVTTTPHYIADITRAFPYPPVDKVSLQRPLGYPELITEVEKMVDAEDYAAGFMELARMLYDDATVLPLFVTSTSTTVDKSVNGFNVAYMAAARPLWSPEQVWLSE